MRRIFQIMPAMFIVFTCFSQQAYKVPIASVGNTIEIAVENASPQMTEGVKVVARDIPGWLHFTQTQQNLDPLKPNMAKIAVFNFSIDKTAPLNKEQHLTFVVSTPLGETWTKEILVSVALPDKFEIFQNYPNPFNPTTKIEYTLPKQSTVKLIIYNVLGQEVQTLVDGVQDGGFKSIEFDAS